MDKDKEQLDRIEELIKAVLRNQLKLGKAICFKEDINLEYFEDGKEK